MKYVKPVTLLAAVLCLSFAVSGCKKKPQGVTALPNPNAPAPYTGDQAGPPKLPDRPITVETEQPRPVPTTNEPGFNPPTDKDFSKWTPDATIFKAETIYFDFDKSNIRPDQTHKLDAVFSKIQTMPGKALRIEGNCDERGTEEYNRALGERRALAAREYLVRKGMDSTMIETISYGKDKPAEPGHNDAAWSKNRRDDFVLLTPPGAGQ
jgi:peptidoglycan-associated lipoprotein